MSTPETPPSGRDPDASHRLPQEDAKGFPRARTVLLVIDPVNDFLSEGGAAWDMTKWTVKNPARNAEPLTGDVDGSPIDVGMRK